VREHAHAFIAMMLRGKELVDVGDRCLGSQRFLRRILRRMKW